MEKTDRGVVVPADIGWSDVGSWSALWEVADKDADGNALRGDVHLADAERLPACARAAAWSRCSASRTWSWSTPTTRCWSRASEPRRRKSRTIVERLEARQAHRARLAPRGLPPVGLLREHRRRRALPGQAHHGEAGRGAVAADAPPPRRALGRGLAAPRRVTRGEEHDPARRERIDLHPARREAPPGESRARCRST